LPPPQQRQQYHQDLHAANPFSAGNSMAVPVGWGASGHNMLGGRNGDDRRPAADDLDARSRMDGPGTGSALGSRDGGLLDDGPQNLSHDHRSDFDHHLRRILHRLCTTASPRAARLEVLRAALDELLDHFDPAPSGQHEEEELDLGADAVLYQRLSLAYATSSSRRSGDGDAEEEEVELVAAALELVLGRARRERVARSFAGVGQYMLPLLGEMIGKNPNPRPNPYGAAVPQAEGGVANGLVAPGDDRLTRAGGTEREIGIGRRNDPNSPDDGLAHRPPTSTSSAAMYSTEAEDGSPNQRDAANVVNGTNSDWAEEAMEEPEDGQRQQEGIEPDAHDDFNPAVDDDDVDVAAEEEDRYFPWKSEPEDSDDDDDADANADAQEDDSSLGNNKQQRRIRFWDERSAASGSQIRMNPKKNKNAEDGGINSPSSSPAVDHAEEEEEEEGNITAAAAGKIVKILRYYSRVLSAMSPMARQVGLLDALIYQMGRRPGTYQRRKDVDPVVDNIVERDGDGSDMWMASDGTEEGLDMMSGTTGWIMDRRKQQMLDDAEVAPIRVDAVATLVNLACAEENKALLLNHPGLLDAVLDVAHSDPSDEAREHGAIVLMNLAYADDNKVAMGHNDAVLSTLGDLAGDESPFTRKYSSAALLTLACIPENASCLACHREGFILSALSRRLLEDPIEEARINAAEAAFYLAKNADHAATDESVVLALGSHVGLLPSLAHAVVADSQSDVRTYAARALEWLASDIHSGMSCHDNLLRALTKATLWTKTGCIVEALAGQAMVAENRPAMIQHEGLLDALALLALLEDFGDEEVRNCAIGALVELTKEESLQETMAQNEGVMTALTHATLSNSNATFKGKQSPLVTKAKIALKNLAAVLEEE